MDAVERLFKNKLIDEVNIYQYNDFKKQLPKLYDAILKVFRNINLTKVDNGYLILIKKDITKVRLTNTQKNFIFCGVYQRGDKRVLLLEKTKTSGTYYLDSRRMVRKLEECKIGTKIGLVKEGNKIHLTLPHEIVKVGMFKEGSNL